MIRTIIYFTGFWWSLVARIPEARRMKKRKGTIPDLEFYKEVNESTSKWAVNQLTRAGGDIHVDGSENVPKNQAVLFVSNHQSNFDIPVLMGYVPGDKGFIAKSELQKIPMLCTWMTYLNCVFMDRSDLKKSGKAILEGIGILKKGYSMIIFPEGTRSKSNHLLEFKSASFKLAVKAKVPIVPITINGTYRLFEGNHNRICPARVTVTIHPPIDTANLTKEEATELCPRVVALIQSKLD